MESHMAELRKAIQCVTNRKQRASSFERLRRKTMENSKKIWFILDEIAVKCSASHLNRNCPICDKAEEAMRLCPEKPTPQECKELYRERYGS